jgi:hypothetical protein
MGRHPLSSLTCRGLTTTAAVLNGYPILVQVQPPLIWNA